MKRTEQYTEQLSRLYPELHQADEKERILTQTVTFQVTDDCNLACTYCYQIKKGKRKMSLETAEKMIDLLLTGEKGMKDYINPHKSPGLIIDFIGGEPLLEAKLIDQICSYAIGRMIELNHPWLDKTMFSICSNGTLYHDPEVRKVLDKWKNRLSFSVTVDGNQELHDSCRIFPDGSPSYDLAVSAAKDWMDKGNYMGSKITIAPANVMHTYDAIIHMFELGYNEINANCVYEDGWKPIHATVLYNEMKRLADYILENNMDFENDYYCSLFEEEFFHPKQEDDLENWCGGNGVMLAVDPDGIIYPCLRYMETPKRDVYICMDASLLTTDMNAAKTRYKKVAAQVAYTAASWKYISKCFVDPALGIMVPTETKAGSTTGFCNGLYTDSGTSGQREWLSVGSLGIGSIYGLWVLYANFGVGFAYWYFVSGVSPNGTRGEWQAAA